MNFFDSSGAASVLYHSLFDAVHTKPPNSPVYNSNDIAGNFDSYGSAIELLVGHKALRN